MTPTVSFIIPTYNEAKFISSVIHSIQDYASADLSFEIIIVDNGSKDKTLAIADHLGVKTFLCPNVTIAALRNYGAQKSRGEVFVFIDGDVYLTPIWFKNFPLVLADLMKEPMTITGSRCGISEFPSWIERFWFAPLLTEKSNYINSGHLLISKQLFSKVGGFDEQLITGEDSDLALRAKKINAVIVNNPSLQVIHNGYPATLIAFIKREIWHAKSNYRSLKVILRSKTALLSIAFLLTHFFLFGSLVIYRNKSLISFLVFSILLICVLSSFVKYRRPFQIVILNGFLYYFYFLARGISFLKEVFSMVRNRVLGKPNPCVIDNPRNGKAI